MEYDNFRNFPVLQRITGGFRHGMFCNTLEDRLRQVVHHQMLCRAGLPWPPPLDGPRYWSADPVRQSRNRGDYHGLRLASLSIINRLIAQVLAEAADREAVIISRRFKFRSRYPIYRAIAGNKRHAELATEFPVLALAIFDPHFGFPSLSFDQREHDRDFELWERHYLDEQNARRHAIALVDQGAPMKVVAAFMGVPMPFRKIRPGAANRIDISLLAEAAWNKRLIYDRMPASLPRMKLWLDAVLRSSGLGNDFIQWVAKRVFEIPGGAEQIINVIYDIKDWVRESNHA